jgi:signal-transduction protein with cAMP-binding, CBS, and nucleotidyltransferase domain
LNHTNHTFAPENFDFYLQNRALRNAQLKEKVEEMILAEANSRKVLRFLEEKAKRIEDVKAISNLRQKLKSKGEFCNESISNANFISYGI